MANNEDKLSEGRKAWIDSIVLRILLLGPIILFGLLGYYDILEGLISIVLIVLCYIFLIPVSIYYIHYRDKRESQKRLEMREMEDKVFRKNLRK